jgi:hypothetical protein
VTVASHERETTLAVAAVAGVLDRCWVVREGLERIDWGWLLARLDALGLGAIAFAEAERARISERLPAQVRDHLRRRAEELAAQNAQLLAAALRTGALLDAAAIPWMPMKGVALAIVAPEYSSSRLTSDFDVLVRPADLDRAAQVLRGALTLTAEAADYRGVTMRAEAAGDTPHVFEFHTSDGVMVELHHGIPGLDARGTAAFWSRSVERSVGGRTLRLPSPEDLLATLCLHVLVHHRRELGMLPRHLADVRALWAVEVEEVDATTGGASAAVTESRRELDAAAAWAEARGRRRPLAARAVDPGLLDAASSVARRLTGLGERVRGRVGGSGLRAIFPDRAYLLRYFGGNAQQTPLWLLHPRRWARLIARTIRGK